jgi:hypothetical protein
VKSALVVLVLLAACEPKKAEPNGIGQWRFGHTTPKIARKYGLCDHTDTSTGRKVTWCHQMPPLKIANRNTTVDLYFDAHDDDANLIEIQLVVVGCNEDDLDRWIRTALGPPSETRSTRSYWQNSFMWVAALMPAEPGRCRMHFLPLSEKTEIERLKQK